MKSDEDDLAFLPGFAWAIPEAFAAAVCHYRFEQGDVLYRDWRGYAALAERIPRDLTAIQLREPPRSGRALASEFEGDRRLANWQSEVELERIDLESGASVVLTTTQGRLLMTLWKGDEGWLAAERPEPPLPRSGRELAQRLREGVLALGTARGEGARFAFVVDLSSDSARAKASAVADALRALGPVAIADRAPSELGAADADEFHPTLVVRDLVVRGAAVADVEVALKRVLYAGGGAAERFQTARHGLLEPLTGPGTH